jgi:hypothetical protein
MWFQLGRLCKYLGLSAVINTHVLFEIQTLAFKERYNLCPQRISMQKTYLHENVIHYNTNIFYISTLLSVTTENWYLYNI